jgi:hypothetical protein
MQRGTLDTFADTAPGIPLPSYENAAADHTSAQNVPASILSRQYTTPLRTHPIIGLYRTEAPDDLQISISQSPHNLLFYVANNSSSVELHTLHSMGPIIASAKLRPAGTVVADIDIDISMSPRQTMGLDRYKTKRVTMFKDGFIRPCHAFNIRLPTLGKLEKFEWKQSRSDEIVKLNGDTKGIKLVRHATEEVLAVFCNTKDIRRVGKFSWIGKTDLGEELELVSLVTLLCILQSTRKKGVDDWMAADAATGTSFLGVSTSLF